MSAAPPRVSAPTLPPASRNGTANVASTAAAVAQQAQTQARCPRSSENFVLGMKSSMRAEATNTALVTVPTRNGTRIQAALPAVRRSLGRWSSPTKRLAASVTREIAKGSYE